MIVYVLMILSIILIYFILNTNKNIKNSKKIFCILSAIILIAISSLRSVETVKSDLLALYLPAFNTVQKLSFAKVFLRFGDTEPIFYIMTKIITLFSKNFNLYLAIIAIPTISAFIYFIYKYSEKPCLSVLCYIGFNYYFLSYITLRNSLAAAFLVVAYVRLIENKNKRFIALTLIASLFHKTALIFLIGLFVKKIKFNYKQYIIIGFCLAIAIFFKNQFMNILFSFINTGHYALYAYRDETINLNMFLINIFLLVFCHIFKKEDKKSIDNIHMNFLAIGTAFSAMTPIMDIMFRFSLFFSISEIVLIPNVISKIQNEQQRLLFKYLFAIFIIAYCLFSTISNYELQNYMFFWQ